MSVRDMAALALIAVFIMLVGLGVPALISTDEVPIWLIVPLVMSVAVVFVWAIQALLTGCDNKGKK